MSQHETFQDPETVPELNAIVRQALTSLIAQVPVSCARPTAPPVLDEAKIVERLVRAATASDRGALCQAADALNSYGVDDETIANQYIPIVARSLGASWVDGTLEFSTVSIGCARLQGHLRQRRFEADLGKITKVPPVARVLLFVPEFEQHTLGAILLAGQLRAAGVDVDLDCQAATGSSERHASARAYNAILISSSQSETLGALRNVIQALKNGGTRASIIVGGPILDQISNARDQTGADFTANCWQDVLGVITSGARYEKADPVGRMS